MTINELKKFHIDNNYYVNIKPLDKMLGCYVFFPENVLQNKKSVTRTYIISEDYQEIEVFHTENDKTTSKTTTTKRFNTRLLILEDILLRSISRNISKDLVLIDGGKIQSNIFEIVGVKLSQEDLKLEKELCEFFLVLLDGKAVENIEDPVLLNGYEQVLECFEKGGL